MRDHLAEIIIATALFVIVSGMGFVAARWRRPENMAHLDEWGLGGRNFGSWISWFLIGGDIYTAYTFVAVPALLFASGALGFYAVPYTVIVYPLVFIPLVPAVGGVAQARVRHAGRLRPGPVGLVDDGAAGGGHRHRRHHALHRTPTRRYRGGTEDDERQRRPGR